MEKMANIGHYMLLEVYSHSACCAVYYKSVTLCKEVASRSTRLIVFLQIFTTVATHVFVCMCV